MKAATAETSRLGIKSGHPFTYGDQILPEKSGLIFPTYFHKTYSPLFIVKHSAQQNDYLRRVSR